MKVVISSSLRITQLVFFKGLFGGLFNFAYSWDVSVQGNTVHSGSLQYAYLNLLVQKLPDNRVDKNTFSITVSVHKNPRSDHCQ